MANRLLSFAVLVLATGTLLSLRRQRPRSHEQPKVKPMPVQTWEGEGGALPATGAQMGPDPTAAVPADEAAGNPAGIH